MALPLQARSVKTLDKIVAAAEALIGRRGIASLTMDAVAAEAGVSKGGLLHHFRSKEALIAGLVSRKLDAIRAGTLAEEEALGDAPNRALLGMIRHSRREYGAEPGFPPALLVAATENSDCLAEFQTLLGAKLVAIRAATARPDEASVLVFAALGLLLSRTLGFSTLDNAQADRIFAAIERQADCGNEPEDKATSIP